MSLLSLLASCLIASSVLLGSVVAEGAAPLDSAAVASSVLNDLRSKYNDSAALEIVFDVTIYWSVREKEDKLSGHAWLARGDRFKLESGNVLYSSDGRTYWQYNKQTNQVIIKNLLDVDLSILPSQMFTDYVQNYTYRIASLGNDRTVLKSTGVPSGHVQSITITVKTKTNTIESIVVNDKNGNRSTYTISKIRAGIKLTDDNFVFEIPKGANVFDSRP